VVQIDKLYDPSGYQTILKLTGSVSGTNLSTSREFGPDPTQLVRPNKPETLAQEPPHKVVHVDKLYDPQSGRKSPSSIPLICTTSRRIPARASTNQGPENGDLIPHRNRRTKWCMSTSCTTHADTRLFSS